MQHFQNFNIKIRGPSIRIGPLKLNAAFCPKNILKSSLVPTVFVKVVFTILNSKGYCFFKRKKIDKSGKRTFDMFSLTFFKNPSIQIRISYTVSDPDPTTYVNKDPGSAILEKSQKRHSVTRLSLEVKNLVTLFFVLLLYNSNRLRMLLLDQTRHTLGNVGPPLLVDGPS
jgi:hypothetical protein